MPEFGLAFQGSYHPGGVVELFGRRDLRFLAPAPAPPRASTSMLLEFDRVTGRYVYACKNDFTSQADVDAYVGGPGWTFMALPLVPDFTGQPSSTSEDAVLAPAPQITVRDPLGNVATHFTGFVTMFLNYVDVHTDANGFPDETAVLAGGTSVAAVSGVATFSSLLVTNVLFPGTYCLKARATNPPWVIEQLSGVFGITPS